jgi:hypothetical protein
VNPAKRDDVIENLWFCEDAAPTALLSRSDVMKIARHFQCQVKTPKIQVPQRRMKISD